MSNLTCRCPIHLTCPRISYNKSHKIFHVLCGSSSCNQFDYYGYSSHYKNKTMNSIILTTITGWNNTVRKYGP